jgi:hypothetical protein
MKQNNCQGCGCINKDQCICMKEEYEDKFIIRHPAGVDITFNSWEEYNKYMVYENKVRKEHIDRAYETGIKDGVKEKVSKGQDKSNKDKSQSKLELAEPAEIKVKVNNVDEMIKIWDVLYPKN